MWQDIVVAIVNLAFCILIIPQIRDVIKYKIIMNYYTCGLTGLGCLILSATWFTLGLYYSMVVSAISGVTWILLFILSVKNSTVIRNEQNLPEREDERGEGPQPILDEARSPVVPQAPEQGVQASGEAIFYEI
jgi:hypothetical protein